MSIHNIHFYGEIRKNYPWIITKYSTEANLICQGPVVQRVVSLTSLLMVKMLTVLVSTISNSLVFFAEKMWFAKATHIFSAKILVYMPYLMNKFLTIC